MHEGLGRLRRAVGRVVGRRSAGYRRRGRPAPATAAAYAGDYLGVPLTAERFADVAAAVRAARTAS